MASSTEWLRGSEPEEASKDMESLLVSNHTLSQGRRETRSSKAGWRARGTQKNLGQLGLGAGTCLEAS